MGVVDSLVSFVNEQKKTSHKITVIVVIIISVVIMDNVFGLSFHYTINNKMNDLKNVNSIIYDPNSDSITKNEAIRLRSQIINRKSWFSYFSFRKISRNENTATIINPATNPNAKLSPIRNDFVYILSTSGIFIFMGISIIGILLFSYNPHLSLSDKLVQSVYYFILFSGFGIGLTMVFNGVPRFRATSWDINYYLYTLIQILILYLLAKFHFYMRELDQIKREKELDTKLSNLTENSTNPHTP